MRKLLLLTPFALAACSDSETREEPTPAPTVAQPRALASADFDLRALGARIVGPQGPQVETVLSAGNREIAKMVSYVACPEEFDECNPGELPEGTLFTYVHEVTLAEEAADDSPAETTEGPEVVESPPTLFRTTERAHGSNFAVGYSNSQALEALGNEDAISITADDGRLIWRVVEGDGWAPGTTITFWWQSTQPPAGPADAYLLEVNGNQAIARGPFPAEEKRAEQTPAN